MSASVDRLRHCPRSTNPRSLLAWLAAILLCACDDGSGGGSVPHTSAAAPARPGLNGTRLSGPHTVEGQVFDPYTGPIAGAGVNLWVQQGGWGVSYWWSNGALWTDEQGRFTAPDIPDSQISVHAVRDGYVQQCAVTVALRSNVTLNVEMTSESTLESPTPPPPQSARGTHVTGLIFETTQAGRQPVAGAHVLADQAPDWAFANTISDLQGKFLLCNLPAAYTFLHVGTPGFSGSDVELTDPSKVTRLEIELKRL